MKWILIIPLLFLQFQGISQAGRDTIISKTDKEIYLLGETVEIQLKSRKSFRLMTNGDCSSSILAPFYMREEKGKWTEPEMPGWMCCGLPYSMRIKKRDYEMVFEKIGRYKIGVFTDKGFVMSNIFEVVNH